MSIRYFHFDSWFNSLTVSENMNDNYNNTMLDLVNNKKDISSYINSHNFIVNNLGFIEKDNNDKFFVEIEIPKIADVTTGFIACDYQESEGLSNDVKMNLIINSKILPITADTKIVNACVFYTKIKIRLTFTDQPFNVKLKYICHVLHPLLVENLIEKRFMQDVLMYGDGVVIAC